MPRPARITLPPEKREETYRKQTRAAELRRKGWRWQDIADELGLPGGRGQAWGMVNRLLKEHQSLAYDEIALYRQESLDRLTDLLKVAMEKALLGDEKMMHQARMIISQIGDLTGEKAPVQVQIGESDVDRTLRELSEELNRRAAATSGEAAGDQAPTG